MVVIYMDDVPLLVDTGDSPELDDSKEVPITIVTGYLGSGKSTMLKHITENNKGLKIAIILNEFGDSADIERSLTVSQDDTEVEEWLELDNGCLCCTAKDAGVQAIENLMSRKGKFDYIILETTGIADPAPIAAMFWLDDALNSCIKLDGIVTVVDAKNIEKSIETGSTARVQLACADVVVINKVDEAGDLGRIKQLIRSINGAAKVVECTYGRVDVGDILDLRAYSTFDESAFGTSPGHDTDIGTVTVQFGELGPEDVPRIEAKLQHLLWEHEVDGHEVEIHRVKGRLCSSEGTKIIQGVRETYDMIDVPPEDAQSKLVLIGRGVEAARGDIERFFA